MSESPRRRLLAFLPLIILAAVAVFFAVSVMTGAPKRKSALIGKEAPSLSLAAISGTGVPAPAPSLKGRVTVVNFWASWCAPCKLEHPVLMEMSKRGDIVLAGIDWKDNPDTAKSYLVHLGNPFAELGADATGHTGIDWGISGVPETFVVGPDGRVLTHYEGPLTEEALIQLGIGE
jgi:cytochrome c biogenesis protein CcmG/thiol:disulfide interchange protein DsbE